MEFEPKTSQPTEKPMGVVVRTVAELVMERVLSVRVRLIEDRELPIAFCIPSVDAETVPLFIICTVELVRVIFVVAKAWLPVAEKFPEFTITGAELTKVRLLLLRVIEVVLLRPVPIKGLGVAGILITGPVLFKSRLPLVRVDVVVTISEAAKLLILLTVP
jgi:hypothetical protein